MKTCFKCQQSKPLSEFYAHPQMLDGHLNKCKECTKTDVRERRAANIDYYQEYDRRRANDPRRVLARAEYAKSEAGKASHKNSVERWTDKHPERRKASHMVSNAVRDGAINPWPVCAIPECEKKPQAHHPDYSRPLDVVWLCPEHHAGAHNIVREINRKKKKVA